jgi:hypothetical protein
MLGSERGRDVINSRMPAAGVRDKLGDLFGGNVLAQERRTIQFRMR